MKSYAIYASGHCTRIKKAIEKYPEIIQQIKCIIVDEKINTDIQTFFENKGIKYYSFDYNSMTKQVDRNLYLSNFILDVLKTHAVDYCLSFGGHILKGRLQDEYEYRLVNFHPGIIPDVIGLHAIDKAISNNNRFIGNTVHFIDSGVDSGPIIMQNVFLADNFETYGYDLFLDGQIELIYKTIKLLDNDRVKVVDKKVVIKDADYTVSRTFPEFSI